MKLTDAELKAHGMNRDHTYSSDAIDAERAANIEIVKLKRILDTVVDRDVRRAILGAVTALNESPGGSRSSTATHRGSVRPERIHEA